MLASSVSGILEHRLRQENSEKVTRDGHNKVSLRLAQKQYLKIIATVDLRNTFRKDFFDGK